MILHCLLGLSIDIILDLEVRGGYTRDKIMGITHYIENTVCISFAGQYLEIDLDVHNYAYLARRALAGYINRLKTVIFENAFLLQGNREEELPEMMIGGSRVYKMDFLAASSFPAQEIENIRLQCTPDGEPASEYSAV